MNLDCYLINLQRRHDRRLYALMQFKHEKMFVSTVKAPDSVTFEDARTWRNIGARACAVAHRLAWRNARKASKGTIAVFEDDIILMRGIGNFIVNFKLPENWNICYLGCVFLDPPELIQPNLLRVTGRTWDMHAYLIRLDFAKELAPALRYPSRRALKGNVADVDRSAIDVIVSQYHATHPAYAVWPPMAWQMTGLSNNENGVRGNYRADGTQNIFRHAIRHLPGVVD